MMPAASDVLAAGLLFDVDIEPVFDYIFSRLIEQGIKPE